MVSIPEPLEPHELDRADLAPLLASNGELFQAIEWTWKDPARPYGPTCDVYGPFPSYAEARTVADALDARHAGQPVPKPCGVIRVYRDERGGIRAQPEHMIPGSRTNTGKNSDSSS